LHVFVRMPPTAVIEMVADGRSHIAVEHAASERPSTEGLLATTPTPEAKPPRLGSVASVKPSTQAGACNAMAMEIDTLRRR